MGLERPATISQLKESSRLYLPDIYFLYETKQSKGFVETVSRKLRFGNRWDTYDPIGKKGGLIVAWKQGVEVKHLIKKIRLLHRNTGGTRGQWGRPMVNFCVC